MSGRRVARIIGIIFGSILLFMMIGLVVLQLASTRRYVLGKVVEQAQAAGVDLQASSLDYNLLAGDVTMHNLMVRSHATPELPPIAKAELAHVNLALLPLLKGDVEIQGAELQHPEIHVVTAEDGRANIPQSNKPKDPNAKTTIPRIARMEVRDGALTYEDRAKKMSLVLPKWQAAIRGGVGDSEHVRLYTDEAGKLTASGRDVRVEKVDFDGTLKDNANAVDVKKLELIADVAELNASGTVKNFDNPATSLKADAKLDLAHVAALINSKEPMSGMLNVTLAAEGAAKDLRLSLHAASDKLLVAGITRLEATADAHYDEDADIVTLSSVDLNTSDGKLHASGRVALEDGNTSKIEAQLSQLNLLRITRALNLSMKVASTATGTVTASFPGTQVKKANGQAQLHFVRLQSRPSEKVLPLSGSVKAIAKNGAITLLIGNNSGASIGELLQQPGRLHPAALRGDVAGHMQPAVLRMRLRQGVWRVVDSGRLMRAGARRQEASAQQMAAKTAANPVEVLAALLRGRITLTPKGELSGTLTADFEDAQETLNRLQLLLGEAKPLLPVPVHGRAHVSVALSGKMDAPIADIKMTAPGLSVGQLNGVAVALNALYKPSEVTVRSGHITWQDAVVDLAGDVGLKGKNPPIDVTAKLANVSVASLMAAAQKQTLGASGVLNGDARVTGTTKSPNATFAMRGENLVVNGEPLGRLGARGTLKNNTLDLAQLSIAKPDGGRLDAKGQYNLTSGKYAVDANAKNFAIHNVQLSSGNTFTGVFNLTAHGAGTKEHPQLTATIRGTGLKAGKVDIGSVTLDANVANQRADLKAQVPLYNFSANANVGVQVPYAAQFAVATDHLKLEQLPQEIRAKLKNGTSGTVTASVRGTAALKNPQQTADVTAQVEQLDINFNGQPIRTQGPVTAHYAKQTLSISPATLTAGASRFTVDGQIPLQTATANSNLRINGLIDLPSAMKFAPNLPPETEARGQMQINMTLRGSLKRLAPEGKITLHDAYLSSPQMPAPIQAVNLDVSVERGVAMIRTLTAQFASAKISAQGQLPFSLLPASVPLDRGNGGGPATFRADVTGFNLKSLNKAPENVAGSISLHLEASAPQLNNVNSLQALLRFDQLQFQLSGVQVQQRGQSTIVVQNGRAVVRQFELDGPATRLVLSGSAALAGTRALDLRLNGNTNAELASLFLTGVQLRGGVQINAAAKGTVNTPNLQGNIVMQDGQLAMRDPRVDLSSLNLRLNLNGQRVDIAQLTGTLNGGQVTGGGGFSVGKAGLTKADIRLTGKEVYFDYQGLRTVSDLNLRLRSESEEHLVLGGEIVVTDGSFRRDLNYGSEALRVLSGGGSEIEITKNRSAMLERLRFRTTVRTTSPIAVDNNLAKIGIDTNLQLVGTYYAPSLLGRVTLEEGGELRLQQITAYVDRGMITFVSETRIQPELDVQARTTTAGYDITMQITGPANKLETTFTSNPPLPQPDIISILVFGKPTQDVKNSQMEVAQQQAFSLLAGSLGTALSTQAQNSLGISQVRIDPSLVGGEVNPTARLTLGENITPRLQVVYSSDLVNTTDRLIFGQYDVTKKLNTRVTMQPDNSYRFDVNHDLEFGGENNKDLRFRKPDDRRVGTVQFMGDPYFSQSRLEDKFKVKPGQKYDYFKVRRGLDRLQSFYADQQLLEASVKLHRDENRKTVDLQLQLSPGRKVNFIYEGYTPTSGLRDRVRRIWVDGVFDLQRAQDAVGEIRNELLKRNYIDSKVTYDIKNIGNDRKRVLFQINLGTPYRDVRVSFQGTHGIPAEELSKALDKNKLNETVITDFGKVKSFLEGYYRDQGFLTVNVEESHLVTDPQTKVVRIVVPVEEGPQYTIGSLTFHGNNVVPEDKLRRALPELRPGTPYVPTKRDPSLLTVQTEFWNAGYNNADITYHVNPHPENAKVDVMFDIKPGPKAVVKDINVSGTDQTTAGMIKSQIELRPGESLNYEKLSKSRMNLYETSAFQLVEVQPRPVGQPAADGTRPVSLRVNVREVQPFQWRYGFYYDTDRGPGVSSDFSNHNTLGNARVLGLYTRYDRDLQEARLYFNQPFIRRLPLKINFAGYFNRFTHYAPGTSDKTYIDDHFGFTVDNEMRFRKDYVLTYGYQLERARVIDLTPAIPPTDNVQLLAPLTFGLTRDRRNDPLNASRGDFMSQGFLAGFSALGSSQQFIKYTGQYNQYLPLGERTHIPFTKAYKSRLVYAGSIRVGLARGLGGSSEQITSFNGQSTLIATERFFAGGGTTIRGFKQDEVGPKNSVGNPLGGDAMLILNNELRFPLWKMFDGVGFIDAGNVWPTIGDFDITDIRKTAGVGLRVYTPFVLLRADYGLKLDRRTGESSGAFFFSIGQAF